MDTINKREDKHILICRDTGVKVWLSSWELKGGEGILLLVNNSMKVVGNVLNRAALGCEGYGCDSWFLSSYQTQYEGN